MVKPSHKHYFEQCESGSSDQALSKTVAELAKSVAELKETSGAGKATECECCKQLEQKVAKLECFAESLLASLVDIHTIADAPSFKAFKADFNINECSANKPVAVDDENGEVSPTGTTDTVGGDTATITNCSEGKYRFDTLDEFKQWVESLDESTLSKWNNSDWLKGPVSYAETVNFEGQPTFSVSTEDTGYYMTPPTLSILKGRCDTPDYDAGYANTED